MRDAYLHGAVLQVGLAVVVVTQIQFLGKHHVEQGPHRQFLLAAGGAADYLKLFEFIAGDRGAQAAQLIFVLGDFPDADLRTVF